MIRKGQDWGRQAPVPDDAVVVASDAAAAEVIAAARGAGRPVPALHLTGGDLARTLGGGVARRTATQVTVDVGTASLDGVVHWFVGAVVLRRSWWRGRVVVITNAAFLGDWNIAPKAHPGDGRLDVLDGDLPFGQRVLARRRLRSGTHVPHPAISTRRCRDLSLRFERPVRAEVDGVTAGRVTSVEVAVAAPVDVWV